MCTCGLLCLCVSASAKFLKKFNLKEFEILEAFIISGLSRLANGKNHSQAGKEDEG